MPQQENKFNKRLLYYNSVTVREILARYRNQFPELVNTVVDPDIRGEVERFSSKVKVNVDFFQVSSAETKGTRGKHPRQTALERFHRRIQEFQRTSDHFVVRQQREVPEAERTAQCHRQLNSSTTTPTTTGKYSATS